MRFDSKPREISQTQSWDFFLAFYWSRGIPDSRLEQLANLITKHSFNKVALQTSLPALCKRNPSFKSKSFKILEIESIKTAQRHWRALIYMETHPISVRAIEIIPFRSSLELKTS